MRLRTSFFKKLFFSASGSLELLVLNEQQISVAGDLGQLSPMVRNLTELDLAFNHLSSWREVSKFASFFTFVFMIIFALFFLGVYYTFPNASSRARQFKSKSVERVVDKRRRLAKIDFIEFIDGKRQRSTVDDAEIE